MRERITLIKQEVAGLCLDVGCGALTLHQAIDGPNTYGLDISKRLLIGKDRIVQGDAQILPFKDGAFDTVVAGDLIEHLPEPGLFIKESHRVLRQNGKLIVTTHNRSSWLNRLVHNYHHEEHVSLMDGQELRGSVKERFLIIKFLYLAPECAASYNPGAMGQYISWAYGRPGLVKILSLPLFKRMACYLENHKFFLRLRRTANLFLPPPLREEMLIVCTKLESKQI